MNTILSSLSDAYREARAQRRRPLAQQIQSTMMRNFPRREVLAITSEIDRTTQAADEPAPTRTYRDWVPGMGSVAGEKKIPSQVAASPKKVAADKKEAQDTGTVEEKDLAAGTYAALAELSDKDLADRFGGLKGLKEYLSSIGVEVPEKAGVKRTAGIFRKAVTI